MNFGLFLTHFNKRVLARFAPLLDSFGGRLLVLFLLTLPLGTRILILHFWGDAPSDIFSAFVYLSDITTLTFISLVFLGSHTRIFKLDKVDLLLFGLLLLSLFSLGVSESKELALWQTFKLFAGMSLFWAIRAYLTAPAQENHPGRADLRWFGFRLPLLTLIFVGLFESILAIVQFLRQSALGFAYLGEPLLGIDYSSSAKFLVEGARIVRPAGTLPHANVLAAFILVSILVLWYLWLSWHPSLKPAKSSGALPFEFVYSYFREGVGLSVFSIVLFPLLLALLLSFSRSGWAAFILMAAAAILIILFNAALGRRYGRSALLAALVTIFILSFFMFTLSPFVNSRNPSLDEPAVVQRVLYNRAAIAMIKDYPWLGAGNGNFVLRLSNYLEKPFPFWQSQPVHNVFLLVGSELGIFGLILLIALFTVLWRRASWFGRVVLIGFLAIMMSDHYLWTLQQGRLLFWLGLGVVASLGTRAEAEQDIEQKQNLSL